MKRKARIIVRLKGGLGNQLFQYAFGFALARRNGIAFKLDVLSGFADDLVYKRKYALAPFNISAESATPLESYTGIAGRLSRKLDRLYSQRVPLARRTHIAEASARYAPEVAALRPTGRVYLDGHWQSEKYFSDAAGPLRRELTLKGRPSPGGEKAAAEIRAREAVCLHVRRADYVHDETTRKVYHCCDQGYYRRAAAVVAAKSSKPAFFVFSDDPEWVKASLDIGFPFQVVSRSGEDRTHEELWLMSLCRHNIIANSSFSWWGAWLNDHPGKIVVAPDTWYNDPAMESPDLVPAIWLRC